MPTTLSNDRIVTWVTRPERPKGAKDEVKEALEVGAQRAPKLLVHDISQDSDDDFLGDFAMIFISKPMRTLKVSVTLTLNIYTFRVMLIRG